MTTDGQAVRSSFEFNSPALRGIFYYLWRFSFGCILEINWAYIHKETAKYTQTKWRGSRHVLSAEFIHPYHLLTRLVCLSKLVYERLSLMFASSMLLHSKDSKDKSQRLLVPIYMWLVEVRFQNRTRKETLSPRTLWLYTAKILLYRCGLLTFFFLPFISQFWYLFRLCILSEVRKKNFSLTAVLIPCFIVSIERDEKGKLQFSSIAPSFIFFEQGAAESFRPLESFPLCAKPVPKIMNQENCWTVCHAIFAVETYSSCKYSCS